METRSRLEQGYCAPVTEPEVLPADAPWEAPVPLLEVPELPVFPVGCLPAWVREWVVALAAEKGASVDIAANLALAVVSGAIARHVQVSPGLAGTNRRTCT